jgi:hypothetical protein
VHKSRGEQIFLPIGFTIFAQIIFEAMPYRRLPTTDKARIRALDAALKKASQKNQDKFGVLTLLLDELKEVKLKFENTLIQYELDIKIQSERNQDYRIVLESAKMYVSHFIQVIFLSSERGEINGGIKYYGLKEFDGKVPPLNTEEEILYWGNKIIDGEQKRIQNGGSAIYNPSIAMVKIKVEEFYDAAIFQRNLRKNTSRSFDKMRAIRKTTNEFISRMWSKIEENTTIEDAKVKRQILEEYGLVYIFRRSEKKKLKENPKEFQKEMQRDLVFDFG